MIDSRRVWSLGFMAVLCGGLYACSSLPETSRTAAVHDVNVEENLSAENLLIQPGDEVRWINNRKGGVRVEIPNLKSEDLSCQRGFLNWMGSPGEVVELKANETVSLCFKKPAVINYNVRAETLVGPGKQILPGIIRVGNPMPQ
jgi:hypothetical protein